MVTIGAAHLECCTGSMMPRDCTHSSSFSTFSFIAKGTVWGLKNLGYSLINVQGHRRAVELPKLALKKVSMFIKDILQFLGCLDIVYIWSYYVYLKGL